jgi:ribose transport system permease protein
MSTEELDASDLPHRPTILVRLLRLSRGLTGDIAPLVVLISLVLAVGVADPAFLSAYSLGVLARESSVILLLAIGQTMVIILGRIDLSVAALASLTSVLIASYLPNLGAAALLGALALATLIGTLQGLVHARAQIPSFVVTLAGLGLWSGVALSIAQTTVPVEDGYAVVGWLEGDSFGLSHAFLFALAALGLLQVALSRLPLGRYLYAIGMGERTALLSGVRVWRITALAFAVSGLFAGLAGAVMVARTDSGNPTIADALLLPSIAAVLIGGTAITGGYGGLLRTLVGVLIITVMRVGIAAVGLHPAYEPIAYGVLVVIAVALTVERAKLGTVK